MYTLIGVTCVLCGVCSLFLKRKVAMHIAVFLDGPVDLLKFLTVSVGKYDENNNN